MAVQGQGIDRATPMGATLVSGGTTFRTWAPNARDVFVLTGAAALAPTEIPQRTSRAIVTSFLAAFIINMLISVIWYVLL